jgi:8-oxo-dGTP diphosphatase
MPISRLRTLVLPLSATHLLLGLKREGFGAGKIVGFGGKAEPGESSVQAAIRELFEECGLVVGADALRYAGELRFDFPARPTWDMIAALYVVNQWQGDPVASDEMLPQWYPLTDIPYGRMWQDAAHWLPIVLSGQQVHMRFTFAADNETVARVEADAGA